MCAMHFGHTYVPSSCQDHHYVCLAYLYKNPLNPISAAHMHMDGESSTGYHGQTMRGHNLEENWSFLPQQSSTIRSSSAQCGTAGCPPHSTASATSWVQQRCHVRTYCFVALLPYLWLPTKCSPSLLCGSLNVLWEGRWHRRPFRAECPKYLPRLG